MTQRVIKFRAWNEQQMIYTDDEFRKTDSYLGAGDILKRYDNVMQFTGLKDKNGKEIYEGDLIHRHMNVYWEVRFTKDRWQAHPKYESGLWLDADKFQEAEIIGNIYENPELIK